MLSAVAGGLLLLHACGDPTTPRVGGPPLVGQWSAVRPAPLVQIHLTLLPNGKVLSWGRVGDPQVWDPGTDAFTVVPAPSLLFCAGHDFLPDGRLLVAGGHISDLHGLANTNVFEPRRSAATLRVPGVGATARFAGSAGATTDLR